MHKAAAYEALCRELAYWRAMPEDALIACIGRPAHVQMVSVGGEHIQIEVTVRRQGDVLRIIGVANGPSHWRLERLEEVIAIRLTGY